MKSLLKAETPITTYLSACKILLESEYSTTVVEKVKRELATTKKDGWSNALNGNTELLDIVRRCRLENPYGSHILHWAQTPLWSQNKYC